MTTANAPDRAQLEQLAALLIEHSRTAPPLPCEEIVDGELCGKPVTPARAAVTMAEKGMVLCADCDVEAGLWERESRLSDLERVICETVRQEGQSGAARRLGLSRHQVRRAIIRADRKLQGENVRGHTRAKPRNPQGRCYNGVNTAKAVHSVERDASRAIPRT